MSDKRLDRYTIIVENVTATARGCVDPDGRYVLFSDYESLSRELAEARELLQWSRKYVYHHQRPCDQKGMQTGQVPVVYPENMARLDAFLAALPAQEPKT